MCVHFLKLFTIPSVLNLFELQIENEMLYLEYRMGLYGPLVLVPDSKKKASRIMKGHENGHEIDSSLEYIYHTLFSTFILSQLEYENWPSPRCYSDLVSDIGFCLKLNGHWMNEHFLLLFYLVSAWCSQTKWFSFLLDSQAHYITLFIHVRLTFNAKRFSNQSNTKRSLTDPVTQTEKNDPRTSYSKL